jgi:SAM-dependent methyltransferase
VWPLGEYYTPDWLANRVVSRTVTDPAHDRVLDPACGSGTFLFHAVRLHLSALESAGRSVAQQLDSLTKHVFGIDVHPVAVTLARVTYLLAIGTERLRHHERPPITVPVFLGDTIQWNLPEDMFSFEMLVVPTTDQRSLLPEELRFPDRLLDDTSRFDGLIAELSERVHERRPGSAIPSLAAIFRRFAIREEDRATLSETFALMCSLHDQGRNHIWGYYVRRSRAICLSSL